MAIAPPAGLETASEFPARELPDATWTENYCFVAYDPAAEIGLWSHLGRAPFDQTLWRELTMVYLPTGERLVDKSYGRTEGERGPGAACMQFRCAEPWTRWKMTRDGAALRATASELDSSMAGDRARERLAFDLDVTAVAPVWDWGAVEDAHAWGKLHYEQLCDVTGTFAIGGEQISFNGQGLRDHTRGPRDFTVFESHIWAWANFPSGRGFILLQLIIDGEALDRAVLVEDGALRPVKMGNRPVLAERSNGRDPYVLELEGELIEAELLHELPNGFAGANDICIGYDPAFVETANFETFTRFTWDGEVGYGLTQRAVRER